MSDDEKMRREYRDSQRSRLGLPLQETGGDKGAMSDKFQLHDDLDLDHKIDPVFHLDPSPDPIAFEEAMDDIYFQLQQADDKYNAELVELVDQARAAHNQSLQTAVTQARINELGRADIHLLKQVGNKSYYYETRMAELTKAKKGHQLQ